MLNHFKIIAVFSLSLILFVSCKETEEQKRVKKASKEKLYSMTVQDSIFEFDSTSNTLNVTVETKEIKDIYKTPEKPANIIRKDGTPASQFETTRKVSYFINKSLQSKIDQGKPKGRNLVMRFVVSTDGRMVGLKILNRSYTKLDTIAISTFNQLKRKYKWSPATHLGKPVNSEITIPIKY